MAAADATTTTTNSPSRIYTAATTQAAVESPLCFKYTADGILYVDCEYGVAYSTSSTPPPATTTKTTTVLSPSPSTSSRLKKTPSPTSSPSSSSSSRNSALAASSSTATGPTVITTEGGVWISGSYEGMYASGGAGAVASSSSSAAAAAGGGDHEPNKPSPLPIILSCVFGALFLGCATALLVLLHRRRRARRLSLASPSLLGTSDKPSGNHDHRSGHPIRGALGRPRRWFANDRRHSLAGSGRFSLFAPEELIDSPPSPTTTSASPTSASALARTMTTSEKQQLLREAERAERRAAEGALEDDELALVRRKLDGWAAVAAAASSASSGSIRAPTTTLRAVDDPSSPFADANAVVPGLQRPDGVRLPLSITTALSGSRQPPVSSLPPPLVPPPVVRSDASSGFSYTHTPTELYPGPPNGADPWSPASADDDESSPAGRTASPSDHSHAPLLPRTTSLAGPTPSSARQPDHQAPPTTGRRQEVDAGHLAGLRRYSLRDGQFDEEVEPPAYRW